MKGKLAKQLQLNKHLRNMFNWFAKKITNLSSDCTLGKVDRIMRSSVIENFIKLTKSKLEPEVEKQTEPRPV